MKKIFDEEIKEMRKDTRKDPLLKYLRPFLDLPMFDQLLLVTAYAIITFFSFALSKQPDPEAQKVIVNAIFAGFR